MFHWCSMPTAPRFQVVILMQYSRALLVEHEAAPEDVLHVDVIGGDKPIRVAPNVLLMTGGFLLQMYTIDKWLSCEDARLNVLNDANSQEPHVARDHRWAPAWTSCCRQPSLDSPGVQAQESQAEPPVLLLTAACRMHTGCCVVITLAEALGMNDVDNVIRKRRVHRRGEALGPRQEGVQKRHCR